MYCSYEYCSTFQFIYYSFTYKFARYNHTANVAMKSKKLVSAEADLAGKFVGTFKCDGGNGTTTCKLYRTGKVIIDNELVLSEDDIITFVTSGTWYMNEKNQLVISVKDEKEATVNYLAKTGSDENNAFKGGTIVIAVAIPIVVVIGLGVGLFFILRKKKKTE